MFRKIQLSQYLLGSKKQFAVMPFCSMKKHFTVKSGTAVHFEFPTGR
jgi:hypothetical protein